jgi:anhydro-N-acetylmuramic acid kinase
MSLRRLTTKKTLNVLGLNSGTSADSLDMALMQVSATRTKYLAGQTGRYSASLRQLILDVADSDRVNPDDLIYLDNYLGRYYGEKAARFIRNLSQQGRRVDAIASHGQTVRHLPNKIKKASVALGGTLQLGSADFIAAATAKVVVSDFRQADIALGGEGAPITVAAMHRLFADPGESRLIINIGGMSNYFYFPSKRSRLSSGAADCGPGNSLSDILSREIFGERFDRGGRRARRGVACEKMLLSALMQPFYASSTVSTGRELFGVKMIRQMVKQARRLRLSDDDLFATVAALTVQSIANKVGPLVRADKSLSKLYLTGGGKHNIFFVTGLKQQFPELNVLPIDDLGIDGDYVEAAAYAVMGQACLRSQVSVKTGEQRKGPKPVLGKITQPPKR